MLQVLKSIREFDHITAIAKNDRIQLTLIGYIDEPYKPYETLRPGDLIIFVGSTKSLTGWSTHLLHKLQVKLTSESLPTKLCKNKLYVLNELLIESTTTLSDSYSYGVLTVKLVDGLNDFGIAGFEIYDTILKATEFYLKLLGEKGEINVSAW